ncbi:MAG: SPFH domain-containing protein [Phycisphaerales bacterium]
MSAMIVVIGLFLAAAVLVAAFKSGAQVRGLAGGAAAAIIVIAIGLSSIRHIGSSEVGIVVKNIGTKRLQGGAYIAYSGEQGVQADVLTPGWHFWYWPGIYEVRELPLTEVPSGSIGIVEAKDGKPLPPGQTIAPDWPQESAQKMLDARHFLTVGNGYRGTQATVLMPGKYRLNTELFRVRQAAMTEVLAGEVAVLKANYGKPAGIIVHSTSVESRQGGPGDEPVLLADDGEMGIRATVLGPGRYPLNTEAFGVTEVWTTEMTAQFTKASASNPTTGADSALQQQITERERRRQQQGRILTPESKSVQSPPSASQVPVIHEPALEEREITVRTSDGFSFPVDVRVAYRIKPEQAAVVVAKLGDDEGERFRNVFNSAVRAIFRNNAEGVRALDYVQQRSHQESQSLKMLADELSRFGVTVTAVRIGNVGDEQTLGALLKTQTDREIAKQELTTFMEQQKAAEQKRQLSRATQEAEEEKKLATATYAAKIAEETKKQKITEAQADAEGTTIKAKAQADAYRLIAEQIGKSNAALIEVLKIVGERNIQIAPRVMVTGGNGNAASESTALIGTMLDTMMAREPETKAAAKP